jgi:RND family efflux transporter MFP subunit
MRYLNIFALLPIAGGLLMQAGCSQPTAAQTPANPGVGAPQATVDRVTAGPPARKTLKRFTTQPGKIEAFEETPLYAKVSGYVDKVLVDIGDRVKKDQILATLWVPELTDQLQQKEALVAQAEAEVKQAEAAIRAAEAAAATAAARVQESQAGIKRSEAEYERWKAESNRINELAASGSVTRKIADETLNQFRAADAARQEAQARVDSAKAALNESQANVENAKADLAAAAARRRVAEANLSQAKTMVNYTQITAPYDGVITRRAIDTRHFVQPPAGDGAMPLLVICAADTVRVFVDVPEMEAPLVDLKDAAAIQLQSLPGVEIQGEVTRTSWDLDPANRSLRVEIDIPNSEGQLRPGMYATASILLAERKEVLTLPVTAMVRDGREAFCYRVESGRVYRTPIQLGLRVGNEVEIVSGLKGNETVVLLRADSLKEAQAVEVLKEAAK